MPSLNPQPSDNTKQKHVKQDSKSSRYPVTVAVKKQQYLVGEVARVNNHMSVGAGLVVTTKDKLKQISRFTYFSEGPKVTGVTPVGILKLKVKK
jgi:hypothetical protein